jgi:hypothetical protein
MTQRIKTGQIGFFSLLVLAMLVNIIGQAFHETGHLWVYLAMGREPVWAFTKMVQVWDTPPLDKSGWTETRFEDSRGWLKISSSQGSAAEKLIGAAAGPLAGLLGALLGLVLAVKGRNKAFRQVGLAFTISVSFAALQYYLRSGNRIGGDEADIAMQLGISPAILNVAFAAAFAICLTLALREFPGWRPKLMWLGTVVLGSALTGILMFIVDGFVISQVAQSSPWFRPVLGYAFPVFLVNGLALVGIWLWARVRADMAGSLPMQNRELSSPV